ncbi:MAG: glycosyltransferase [Lachnospiraceae bacterium]|nr:glycosyltransferase [Lachnospiraceae bacterium]
MNNVFYSIIVVCLNAGERLHDTIESILQQKYSNYEIIVKDGGSSDGSVEELQAAFQDERMHIHIRKDNGIYDAMNQAVQLAQGEYDLFLNAGDSFYDETVLDKITEEIERIKNENKKADVIYGNLYHKALDTIIYAAPEINDFTCYRNVPCHQTCFYHRSMFETRGYKPEYNVRADYEHFLWCFYEKKAKIWYVPVIVASYEGGGYSETKENKKRSARQHREIVVRYMGRKKADKYRWIMLLTLAPLRSAIADNKYLSGIYNGLKTAIYKVMKKGS